MIPDKRYMKRAVQLALLGKGNVAPNPLVGAVIVHNDTIIGEGYHEKFGQAHAEVNAIASVQNKALLKEATIYVTLEPCAHFGKTPPCADLIVSHQLKRVVIGSGDSFDQVNGKGIQKIRNAGIEVEAFVLENECRELNRAFFTFQEKKRPFIFLKWAQSTDGFIDAKNSKQGAITWISRPEVQPIVHQWRSEYQAILVGKNTAIEDNPSLNVRAVSGNDPIRIVLDSRLEIPADRKVLSDGAPTIVFNTKTSETKGAVTYVKLAELSVPKILSGLYDLNIQSVLIEGGARTLQSFIDAKMWDEACVIQGQTTLHKGTPAPHIKGTLVSTKTVFGDVLNFYRS